MPPSARAPATARASLFAALLGSWLAGRGAFAQQAGIDAVAPNSGSPAAGVGAGFNAAAVPRIVMAVPIANSAPSASPLVLSGGAVPGAASLARPAAPTSVALPAAAAPTAVPAGPNRADAADALAAGTQGAPDVRAALLQRDSAGGSGRDAPVDRAPGVGIVDFDGRRGAGSREGDPGGLAAPEAPAGGSTRGRVPSIRRPYQLALARLQVPNALIARLDALVAARRPGGPSGRGGDSARRVRTANLVSAMADAAGENSRGKIALVLSGLLREAALAPAKAGSGPRSPLQTLEESPEARALLDDIEKAGLGFDKGLVDAMVAASDIDPDSGKTRRDGEVSAAIASYTAKRAGKYSARRLRTDRWGRRLSFAGELAVFTGTPAEAMRAARAEDAGRPASSDEEVAAAASKRLQALMESPFFALVPSSIRGNVEDVSRFLHSRSGPPSSREAALAQSSQGLPAARGLFHNDTSVEIEIDTYPQILNLLTTPDGTVAGLLGDIPLPGDFSAFYGDRAPGNIPWASLTAKDKLLLLRYVSDMKESDFYEDRRLPRVIMKRKALLKFVRETRFLGKTYPPGRHLVDVSRVFRGAVEYRGPNEVEAVSGVELHFRDNQSAGKVSNDAWILLDGLGVSRTHQHVHIVTSLPIEALERDPAVQAAAMGDFYRRVNLLAEMKSLITGRGAIKMIVKDNVTYFGYARPEAMAGVTEYFEDIGTRRGNRPLGDTFKMGWVGFRGSDKYDEPGLYGLEYRSLAAAADETDSRETLDLIQQSMERDDYGIPKEKIRRWLAKREKGTSASKAVAAAWYNQEWTSVLGGAPAGVRKALYPSLFLLSRKWASFLYEILWTLGFGRSALDRRMETMGEDHAELKMLAYDWSNDPLTFEDDAFQKKIVAQQIRALSRVQAGEEINLVVSDFLVDSGLYDAVSRSIGPRH